MTDRFEINLDNLPPLVRELGDRARDAQHAADDARKLVSRVDSLNGSGRRASGAVAEAQRQAARAQTALFALQRDLAQRGEQLANDNGIPGLAKAIADATKPPPEHHWWDPITSFAGDAWHFVTSNPLESVHIGLDVLGMIPVVGDVANGLNALIYLGQGDYADAALSAVALIPLAGDAAIAARFAGRGIKIAEGVATAERLAADGSNIVRDVRTTEVLAQDGTHLVQAVDASGNVVHDASGMSHGVDIGGGGHGADLGGGGGGGGGPNGIGGGPPPLQRGDVGSYGDLTARGTTGDNLTAHHMPQDARHFLTRDQGGSVAITEAEHRLTRTYFGQGRIVARNEAGLPFADTLNRDINDLLGIAPDLKPSTDKLLKYYHDNYPSLFTGATPP